MTKIIETTVDGKSPITLVVDKIVAVSEGKGGVAMVHVIAGVPVALAESYVSFMAKLKATLK